MPASDPTAAIILCGGQSRRMGQDKAFLRVNDEPFLRRICRSVMPGLAPVVVVAAADQRVPDLPSDVEVITDMLPDAGPLAGLLTGLGELVHLDPTAQTFWLSGCDVPFPCVPAIQRLLGVLGDHDAVLVRHEQQPQPLCGVYHIRILPVARQLITSGERSMSALLRQLNLQLVDSNEFRDLDPELAFLRNINTPEDYQRYVADR